ncbi:Tetratricopeptide-like helical domain containing protein [Parasponia andersonii]|uniref:Tetratricopeptide-like helical domain containing protein n=1 Tax=Parasponia andersonii TaxID=3476 RepID=A0A2P5BL27_PARAD|nr:Tetratricopeptide-like helical domain containing protein [Parasponia andersonii]
MEANPPELHDKKPSKVREEGELSSDGEDMPPLPQEDQACSVSPCTSTDAPAGPVPVPPVNNCSEDFQEGKAVSGNSPASTFDIQSGASIKPMVQKSFDKSRITSNTNTPGWCAPVGAADNLVIRFSDDDSGSDSEGSIKDKATETKSSIIGVVSNQKPPAPSNSKLNKQVSNATVSKVMPKRLSLSRTFVSSMPKIPGSNSRGAGALSVEQGHQVRKFTSLDKNLSSRERGRDQGMGLDNSKLQDLRQQIARRESELKLKFARRSKEAVSFRDDNAVSLPSDAARKIDVISAKSSRREPKEPDKKRAKVTDQLNSIGQQEASVGRFISPLKEPAMQNNNIADTTKFDPGQRGNSVGRTESGIVKWHQKKGELGAGVSENIPVVLKDGSTAIRNCIQSGGSSMRMESSAIVNQDTSSAANKTSNVIPKNLVRNNVELNPSKIGPHQQPSSFFNKATTGKNLLRDNDPHISSSDKIFEPAFNDMCQASPNNESFWNCLSNANLSERSSMNVQSLVEMEESLDKDLEEAQEHRRRCEIEERNALKAYHKAQRSLVEANARCSDLYRKRELYSAHLRSFIMGNSDLLCSSRQNNVSENMLLISSSDQLPEYDGFNPLGVGSNFQYLNSPPVQTSDRHVNGQNMGSEACSEPDASTSEPLCHMGKAAAGGVRTSSNDPNISVEDDDTFSFEHGTAQPNFGYLRKRNNFNDEEKDLNMEPSRKQSIDSSRESFLLEETLRSELFSRLGTKKFSKNRGSCNNIHLTMERGTENDVSSEKAETSLGDFPFSKDEEGPGRWERSNSEAPEIQHDHCIENNSLISHSLTNSEERRFYDKEGSRILVSEISTSNIFKSAFGNLKSTSEVTLREWLTRNRQNYSSDINDTYGCVNSDKIQWSSTKTESTDETVKELFGREIGSYTCDIAVDPFRPLCMYELRGKCNNDECPWQHVRDAIMSRDQNGDSDSDAKVPKFYDIMMSPTYLVGLDTLKTDHSYESALAWRNDQCWQKCFSISLTLSNLHQNDLPAHRLLSHCSDGRIEVLGSWSGQSSYFLSKSGRVNDLKQSLADNEQALETAILIFNQEVDKFEAMKEALPVLSRALEADPKSLVLWIFYLLIYYSNLRLSGKDDMFSYAVKYNEGSYELWLMYINSRAHLDDRLITYNSALLALCHNNSAPDWDGIHASACILDLFLQMIDCLCMSGNAEKAIQKIFELLAADTNSDEPPVLLSDIHSCLRISDKCIFWISCVYLVIYRKLPDAVVQQFECEKQVSEIEWPSIDLLDDEKQRAVKLMEKGVYSLDSLMKTESLKSDLNLRSAHFFAVNHIRCMAALDSLESCRNLLDKYLGLYPSCLELVLISLRTHKQDFVKQSFSGFEETLRNWPKEVPGIQCIWNQYAQCAVQNGGYDFGKKLMERWFHSVCEVHHLQNGTLHGMERENIILASDSILETLSSLDPVDVMFGFLNLSLYKLLQNDRLGARIAVEKALKAAIPIYFKYCIGGHALFLLIDEPQLKKSASVRGMVDILGQYIGESLVFSVPEPLPRKFIDNIKKPRVRQLISNFFTPVSSDFSLVNLVLEVWCGPSLLLELLNEPRCLVDFVEGILDICSSNYELALCVCKLLSGHNNSTDVTPASLLFWASSNLVGAIFHAVPIPPERIWVEVASILGNNIMGVEVISQRFYRRALSVYPFSVKLWKYYQNLYTNPEVKKTIAEEAKSKGIDLG